MQNDLLKIKDLTIKFNTDKGLFTAVEKVDLSVGKPEIVAIVGESGSGKTVTCLSVIGLVSQGNNWLAEGSIAFDGRQMLGMSEKEMSKISGKDIGMIFQEPMTSLNPVFTVEQQIDETLRTHLNLTKQQRRARVIELLKLVGIPEPKKRMKSYPHELSGGMMQRVMIAMALCCNPKMLIADEPTTALDVTIQAQVLTLLKDLKRKLGMSIIIVSHDLGVVANFSERVVVMYAGQIVEEGTTSKIIQHPMHNYTKGLIASIPGTATKRGERLPVIPGNVPDISNMPNGCRFSPRCRFATERCKSKRPPATILQNDHKVYCWEYVKGDNDFAE